MTSVRIVVIDDQQELCNVLAKRISRLNGSFEIVGKAYNGRDGLELIRKTRPDTALIDIRMPFLDGMQLMELLSKEEKQRTKCIILTAYSDFQYTQRAIRNGAFDYLLKPLTNSTLEQVMERVVQEMQDRTSKANGIGATDFSSATESPLFVLDHYAEKQLHALILDRHITDELVLSALKVIATEYMHSITLSSLAERMHVSESHLSRVFTKRVGMNFIQFLNTFRIELAKTLMDDTDLKIGSIAKMTGFYNNTYFGRLFRKHMNLSASEYKQKANPARELPQ